MRETNAATSVEFRPIEGAPKYRIGNDGTIQSLKQKGWINLKPRPDENGYLRVILSVEGKKIERKVHQLVLETFVGPRPPGMQACHAPDHNPANCRLENLRWDTPEENTLDIERQGRRPQGKTHYAAKLSEANVRHIRLLDRSGYKRAEIARKFKISISSVTKIVNRVKWSHTTEGE